MKIIIAIIKPFKLEDVRNALNAIGVPGMTVSEVKGYGRQRGHSELYRGAEYAVTFLPKIKIEVAVPSELVDNTIEAITAAAKTGQIGMGRYLCSTSTRPCAFAPARPTLRHFDNPHFNLLRGTQLKSFATISALPSDRMSWLLRFMSSW